MILLYVIVVVWLVVWLAPIVGRWAVRRGMRQMERNMYRNFGIDPEQMERQRRQRGKRARGTAAPPPRRRRRIIPEGYGEYVRFQTMSVTGTEVWLTATADSPVFRIYRAETQVSDAEYTIV